MLVSFLLTELTMILFCVVLKACLVGRQWGADHSTPFWSWRHFAYFFAQDCFFVWCRSSLGGFGRDSPRKSHPASDGMPDRPWNDRDPTAAMFRLNAVEFGNDCVVDGFLQFHTFEDMILKVKRTRILDRCAVNFGATVMSGAVMERDTTLLPLALVLKEMNMATASYEGSPAEPVTEQISVASGAPHGCPRQP